MSDPTLLVLASLAGGDKHGYAIMDDIQAFAGLRLGPGTLYGAITRLEERGWIRPLDSGDGRRPYRLTALTLISAYLPARAASAVDPMTALRNE